MYHLLSSDVEFEPEPLFYLDVIGAVSLQQSL
ncbi:hypothetical protein D3Z63_16925 [Vibrio parahaemolyticus]|uniref:Uncharacterized protein n=1 Tax=Vibrio parahaemolyticus TaxID=670 RepID=B9A822_VIBPH|nr:hypothetical protein RK51_016980 [Vibrio parahaemolyticus]QGG36263.1 hypothetical protein GH799_24855 [Vibrio parahaemolyticus 10329]EGQ8179226.1 hypothetical protein [Vibrio parahaemolyticus]EGQ8229425.1 hypothetical protein [Vibrio parahaemolyticus]EGQ8236484.1 hypothetical protein [Vibrio parahaemolyticus]